MDEHLTKAFIIHPEVEALTTEIEKLRTEISMLVLECDHLKYVECRNIEMQYMITIGALEYKAYEIECAVLRLKRKMELIQVRKNRQERTILSELERILDAEFAEYQERLAQHLANVTAAIERKRLPMLGESDALELRRLYRLVVKELHPDLQPDQSEDRLRLFHMAVEAYEKGDLQGLGAIQVMADGPLDHVEQYNGISALEREKVRLTDVLDHLNRSIAQIKSIFPYIVKEIVQSPEKTEARLAEINRQIASLNETRAAYDLRIANMLR